MALLRGRCMSDLTRPSVVSCRISCGLLARFLFQFVWFLRLRLVVVYMIRLACLRVWVPVSGRAVGRPYITRISLLLFPRARLWWCLFVLVFRDLLVPLI